MRYGYDCKPVRCGERRGKRVKATVGSTNTVYIGNIYERDNGSSGPM